MATFCDEYDVVVVPEKSAHDFEIQTFGAVEHNALLR